MADLLKSLYEEIYGPLDSPGKIGNLTELGKLLAEQVGRKSAWTSHHLNAVMMGYKGFAMTGELQTAIEALGMKRDGANPLQARLVKVNDIYSINGNLQPGDIVTGKRTRCPGCLTWFVPYSNLQIYCSKVCPGRPPKRKAKKARI